jgi:hypothetical protein
MVARRRAEEPEGMGTTRKLVLAAAGLLVLLALPSKVAIWVDADGRTVLTNREAGPGPGQLELTPEQLALEWRGNLRGEPIQPPAEAPRDPIARELLAARDDLRRGERSRGLAELRRLHRQYPGRPDVAWLLARVEMQRGRFEAARDALDDALSVAAEMPDRWREQALALRTQISDEIALASTSEDGQPERVEKAEHFRVIYDHHFAGRSYGDRVLRLLAHSRGTSQQSLGRVLPRPLDVRIYTRTQYLDAYQHRFGFATVGFYDGAIHVVSGRQPEGELQALLAHEYTHALFQDALGAHRPFFMNEGLAEREEERARGRPALARGEWRRLLEALRAREWIPLETLVAGFGGLEGSRALLAYLESRATIEFIESRRRGALSRWLARCGKGEEWEAALRAETGWDTAALDAALQQHVRSRFPVLPEDTAAGQLSSGAQ